MQPELTMLVFSMINILIIKQSILNNILWDYLTDL